MAESGGRPLGWLARRAAAQVARLSAQVGERLPGPASRILSRLPQLIEEVDREQAVLAASLTAELAPRSLATAQVALARLPALLKLGDPSLVDLYREILLATLAQDRAAGAGVARDLPQRLEGLAPDERGRYLRHLLRVSRVHWSLAHAVSERLPTLMSTMDDAALGAFLTQGLAAWRDNPDKALSFLRVESRSGVVQAQALRRGLPLQEVRRTLGFYAQAHAGAPVRVAPAGERGEGGDGAAPRVFLPEVMERGATPEENFLIYKVMTALEVGRLEFGTYQLKGGELPLPRGWGVGGQGLAAFFASAPEPEIARDLFGVYEAYRVERRLRDTYGGLARDIDQVRGLDVLERRPLESLPVAAALVELLAQRLLGEGAPREPSPELAARLEELLVHSRGLEGEGATVQDSARATLAAYPFVAELLGRRAQPNDPQDSTGVPADRREEAPGRPDPDLKEGYTPLEPLPSRGGFDPSRMEQDPTGAVEAQAARTDALEPTDEPPEGEGEISPVGARTEQEDDASADGAREEGEAGPPPSGAALAREWIQRRLAEQLPQDESRTFSYPEWDFHIDDYKNGWTSVWEAPADREDSEFVARTFAAHAGVVGRLRRQFEKLRREELVRLRRQMQGDGIDIDAVVEAEVMRRAGLTPPEAVYEERRRHSRDVAVAFLVDLSSSTQQVVHGTRSILDIEKEALLLMAESLERLGDPYAIYAFSGYGRKKVSFYVAKDFREAWTPRTQARVGGLTSRLENRDGAAIRHATTRLLAQGSRVRLLILLSDGRPLDCGCQQYFDRYAQEDTRAALNEARRAGVHPFCITVDREASRYLARMYGQVHFTIIDRAGDLPEKLPRIYRRLTT